VSDYKCFKYVTNFCLNKLNFVENGRAEVVQREGFIQHDASSNVR